MTHGFANSTATESAATALSEQSPPEIMALENLKVVENGENIRAKIRENGADIKTERAGITSSTTLSLPSSEAHSTTGDTLSSATATDLASSTTFNLGADPNENSNGSSQSCLNATESLNFHPNYATSKGIILRSTDGTCFGFDFDVLAKHSSFFEGLNSLPCASPAEVGSDPGLELSVCSTAIKFALDVVTEQEYETSRTPLGPTTGASLAEVIKDLITVGDAYELPCLFTAILKDVTALDVEAPIRLTAAIFAEDAAIVRTLAAEFIRHQNELTEPTAWWAVALYYKRPVKFRAIKSMLDTWKGGESSLEQKLAAATQSHTFGQRCRPGLRVRPACTNYQKHDGDFLAFRCNVFQPLWDLVGIRAHSMPEDEDEELTNFSAMAIWQLNKLELDCSVCENRLMRDLDCPSFTSWPPIASPYLDLSKIFA